MLYLNMYKMHLKSATFGSFLIYQSIIISVLPNFFDDFTVKKLRMHQKNLMHPLLL